MAAPTNNLRRGLLITATPVFLLLVLALGMRYASSVTGTDNTDDRFTRGNPFHYTPRPPLIPLDAATQKAAEAVARGQVEALYKGDYATALALSGGGYRSRTKPEQFHEMLKNGYSGLLAAKKVTFQSGRGSATVCLLPTTVTNPAGKTSQFLYILNKEEEGWRVVSCSMTGAPDSRMSVDPRTL